MVCWWTIVNKDFGWVEKTAGRIRMGQKQRKKNLRMEDKIFVSYKGCMYSRRRWNKDKRIR